MNSPPSGTPGGAKDRLRRELRHRRRTLTPAQARSAARHAAQAAWRLPPVAGARHLACYLPVGGELDTTPLIEGAWYRGLRVYLPVLREDRLAFAPYAPGTPLRDNRFGIPEPALPRSSWRSARQIDVIIMPLVGFDGTGQRLGMGGGYYDRTLVFRGFRRAYRRPWLIGYGYGFQEIPHLDADPWDVRLDAVITERGAMRCRHMMSPDHW